MDCYSWLSIQTGRNDGKVALTAHFCLHFSLSLSLSQCLICGTRHSFSWGGFISRICPWR